MANFGDDYERAIATAAHLLTTTMVNIAPKRKSMQIAKDVETFFALPLVSRSIKRMGNAGVAEWLDEERQRQQRNPGIRGTPTKEIDFDMGRAIQRLADKINT